MIDQKNYISNQSVSTEQSLNTSNQNINNSPYNKMNRYYSNIPLNYIKNNQKIIQNKLIPQKESVYYIYQQQNQINTNNKNNQSFNSNISNKFNEDSSFYSQKPVKIFNLNLNINNNNNKLNNIINIDNKSSAFELCFISQKKPKQIYKSSVVYQIGPEQQPLSFAFLSEKNNLNIQNNNSINELNIKNSSFISNKQIENNNPSFIDNETNYSNNISNRKNELKIMQNPGRKSENKPKPILQIMTNSNKSNFPKKLSESNLPHVNGFSLEDNNNNINESLKNNFGNISKSASMIVNNNNINPDISFISNYKETENLLEMNDNSNNNNNKNSNEVFSGLGNNNIYNGYIMINKQLSFISEKNNNKNSNKNNISNISINNKNNSLLKTNAKKYIKIEYYDTQPVSFEILSDIYLEESMININKINEIKLNNYKMYRVEDIQFIKENIEEVEEDKKEENKNVNNSNTKKKRRRKKKK